MQPFTPPEGLACKQKGRQTESRSQITVLLLLLTLWKACRGGVSASITCHKDFFKSCLHTKTPKLSNLTCSSLANDKLHLFSSAALCYLSVQAAASPQSDQITPLLISLLSVNHVLYGKSPTGQAALLLPCVTTKPNHLQATHEQTLFS